MPLVSAFRSLLLCYAQILFSGSVWVGLTLLCATLVMPIPAAMGMLCASAALSTSFLLGLEPEERKSGGYGYNALLCGLGIGHSCALGLGSLLLALMCGVLCALLTAGLRASLGRVHLPLLSIPFILVYHMVLAIVPVAGLSAPYVEPTLEHGPALLRGLGALFFLPKAEVGALVLFALLLHSRISAMLAVTGFAVAYLIGVFGLSLSPETVVLVVSYNAAFAAVAIGGVWFVPSASSFLLGMLASAIATFLCAGLLPLHQRVSVPLLVVPFNATILLLLLALRQRVRDAHPKAVDLMLATPEDNLDYLRARLLRFGWSQPVKMQLPMRGAWICTQGVDGAHTHKERWRHAWDFEVLGPDGKTFRQDGTKPEHYHCFRLPVLAAAAGTVVKVEHDIPDNLVGSMNLKQNWGNLVLIHHAPGLYSLVAHLCQGSIKVRVGQVVQAGDVLGLCGSSGRSPQPHLHFHLQSTADVGAATLPCTFSDAVVAGENRQLVSTALTPKEQQIVRNLEPDEERGSFVASLSPGHGAEWVFQLGGREERVLCEVDVYGQPLLRSVTYGAVLRYVLSDEMYTAYDVSGPRRSVLYLLRTALPRMPLESSETLCWRDLLPGRLVRPQWLQLLHDFVAPIRAQDGVTVELSARRDGALLQVESQSLSARQSKDQDAPHPAAEPALRTRVLLARGLGVVRIEVTRHGRTVRAERITAPSPTEPTQKD